MINLNQFLKQFPFIYPAGIIRSCKTWIDAQNLKGGVYAGLRRHTYQLMEPEENYTHQLPVLATEKDAEKFSNNIFYQTAPAYLFSLKDCYVYKQMGLVLTNRNLLFQEFTHHFNIEPLPKFLRKHPFYAFSNDIKNISGIGAMLVSPQSHNYYHWLFDVLPRIKLYGTVLQHIDHFCISASVPQKFRDVLPLFGIPENKILLVDDNEKLHFDSLYVVSLPGSEGRSPGWAVSYLREKLIKNTGDIVSTKKIYFKRGTATDRKILNEDKIMALLKNKGFDIIDPEDLSIAEQAALIQQASTVVSAHGAAMSNLLFAKDGANVVEIFSPDYFRTDCFFTLARTLKLNYAYIKGTKSPDGKWGDIVVKEDSIDQMLKHLLID